MSYVILFTMFQWSVLLLSSHSAKYVVVDVNWFSTRLDGDAVIGVLEKNMIVCLVDLLSYLQLFLLRHIGRKRIGYLNFWSIFLYFSTYFEQVIFQSTKLFFGHVPISQSCTIILNSRYEYTSEFRLNNNW